MSPAELPLSLMITSLVVLFLLLAFFSGSETALTSLNRYKLRHMANKGDTGARLAQKLLDQPNRLTGLILLGKSIVTILIIQLSTLVSLHLLGHAGLAIMSGVLTLLLLVFAQTIPTTLATQHPESLAFPAAHIYTALLKIVWPMVWLVNAVTNAILRWLHPHKIPASSTALSHDELRSIMHAAGSHIPQSHLDMLISLLDLESATVEDVMIPRNQMVGIDLQDNWSEIEHQLLHSQFTRMLVYEDNIDNTLGFIHSRKMLTLVSEGHLDRNKLRQALRPAYFTPEGTSLTQQLLNFREESRRIAIVVDEYGEILGLLTLEDILEEVVGEFSTVPASHAHEIQTMGDGSHWLDGAMHIREVNRQLNIELPTDGPKTINGLIMEHLESIPVPGMTVLINDHPMEIRKTRKSAVKTLIIYPRIERKSHSEEHV